MAPLLAVLVCAQDKPAVTPAPVAPPSATSAPADVPDTEPAPPEVDQALRARVAQFYQACVNRRFREAENVLAEESRDQFYNSNKPQYNSFEIKTITWLNHYSKAKVMVIVGMDMPMQSFVLHTKPGVEGDWRLIDGQWYQRLPGLEEGIRTPFGSIIKPTPLPANGGPPPAMPNAPAISQTAMKKEAQRIMKGVKPDRTIVQFDSATAGAEQIHIANTTPTPVSIEIRDINLPGLTVKLDKKTVAASKEATATIQWAPTDKIAKPTTMLHLRALPTGQDIAIQVRFSYRPEQNQASAVSKQNADAGKRP